MKGLVTALKNLASEITCSDCVDAQAAHEAIDFEVSSESLAWHEQEKKDICVIDGSQLLLCWSDKDETCAK